jgi:hypothetical protein
MSQAQDFKTNTGSSAHKRQLTLVERGFRPVDKLDYSIRRWAIEDYPRPSSYAPSLHMQTNARLSEPQRAIGQYLRSKYDLAQPIPDRLVALLRKVEQQPAVT